MRKQTVFQPFERGNKDCGLACLEMLTHEPAESFREKLNIKTTRNTKKRELLALLQECGFRVVERGRISGRTPLSSLVDDALLFGRLDGAGHWAVWDASIAALRDPNGYRAPYDVSWYATVRKK